MQLSKVYQVDHTIFADVWYDVLTLKFSVLSPRLYWCLLSNCEGKSENVENLLETVRYHDVILGFVMQLAPRVWRETIYSLCVMPCP